MAPSSPEPAPSTPPAPHEGGLAIVAIATIVILGIVAFIAFVPALVALAPLVVAGIPVGFLVWRARKRRMALERKDIEEHNEDAMAAYDWYEAELERRGDIVDDRVDHLIVRRERKV